MTAGGIDWFRRNSEMDALLWLLLEAGVALALLLFIVWWTWPRSKSDDRGEGGKRGDS